MAQASRARAIRRPGSSPRTRGAAPLAGPAARLQPGLDFKGEADPAQWLAPEALDKLLGRRAGQAAGVVEQCLERERPVIVAALDDERGTVARGHKVHPG